MYSPDILNNILLFVFSYNLLCINHKRFLVTSTALGCFNVANNFQCGTLAQDVGELQVDEHREDFQQRLGMFALQILVRTLVSSSFLT